MQQRRLLLALILSSAILFLWTYLYPAPPPTNQQQSAQSGPSPAATATATQSPAQTAPATAPVTAISQAPQRTITVESDYFRATFDTRGAEPVSWIIKRNKISKTEIYSVAGKKSDKIPLELISPEGLKRQPRSVPMQLQTGDATLDEVLAASTYRVEGVDVTNGDAHVNLAPREKKQLTFVLEDSNGLQVRKAIDFDAEKYETGLAVSVKRGDTSVPQVKVTVGPSIGDQGITYHTFYSVAPEAVAFVGEQLERHLAHAINENSSSPDRLTLNGSMDWAGVADTYFAMVVVPRQKVEGLEYRTVSYEHKPDGGTAEKRYLISALVPLPADGSRSVVYAGPKDHYLLQEVNNELSGAVNRTIDLDGLIDYGFLGWLSRPLAVPILGAITYLYQLTNSYGVAIIIFTIVIYSLFFPLKWRSSKAMKKAQKLAPRMKELQEKIKGMKPNDPRLKELQMDQLRLMKEGNPLGGCLPLLIQMPFLFALYRAITISLDFRQASFLWIPDLSAAEPYLIHILPILMTGTMVVLQLVTPAPSADPLQRKMMAIGMPLFMLYVLWSAPSGLVLYWLVGNIVGFSQQFLINHWTKDDDEPESTPTAVKKVPPRKKPIDSATART
ncbi:MAG: membrane protein insertase YidC [Acidobacteria bacterium]|nr:membrane protein insertase YidC [Acidobacteriota bacterium]MCA1627719.1 membrane protein insertase YidC [Acidobacteriota bacterium]